MGVCGVFRPPVQGGSNELISKFLSSMILYNHPSHFKSGEINSCRLSPLPTIGTTQSALCTFASRTVFTLITLALCVKCRRTLKGTSVSAKDHSVLFS